MSCCIILQLSTLNNKTVGNQEGTRRSGAEDGRRERCPSRSSVRPVGKRSQLFTKAEFLQATACWPPLYLSQGNSRISCFKNISLELSLYFHNTLLPQPTSVPTNSLGNSHREAKYHLGKSPFVHLQLSGA